MSERNDCTPAALYARVSSERQDVDLSVSAQMRALRDYADKNGYKVVREYVDEAESGRVMNRPEFRRMIDEAKKTKAPFNEILVWKFSRFTRKREHAVALKSMLRRQGVRVVSITEQAEDNPTGRLLEGIIESVDEFYSKNLAQEVVRGMREAASRGFWVAPKPPYGYRKVKVLDGPKERPTLEPDEDAALVVKRIFDLAETRMGMLKIARALNDDGIASPRGKLWNKTTVHGILNNEAYTGTLVWGNNAKDNADPVRVEKAFPATVTKAQFDRVNKIMRSRAPKITHPRRVGSTFLLSGLVKCYRCKRALSGRYSSRGTFPYYVCHSFVKRAPGACDSPRVDARQFEELVVSSIRSNILTEGNIRNLVKVVDEQMDGVSGEQRKRLETIESELADVRGRLDRLYDLVETTTEFNMADFAHRIRDHKERQQRLESAAEGARAILSQRRAVLDDVRTITAYAQDMNRFLRKSELTERRAFIETFVKEIELLPDNAVVRYTIPISQSTPKTELLLGGRSEEFRVGNIAETSSQLVWDVEGGLHPEERPRVGLWLSEQFLLSADIFLQSFSSTPTVRPRQHVAIGLGNAVRELASPCTGLGPMVKCPTAALRRRRYGARTDQQPPALLRGSRQGQFWRVRLLQRATDSAGLPDPNAKSANGKATIIIAPNILICHLPFMQELPA